MRKTTNHDELDVVFIDDKEHVMMNTTYVY